MKSRRLQHCLRLAALLVGALALVEPALAQFEVFHARASYTAVMMQQGRVQLDEDYDESDAIEIEVGQRIGDFLHFFDSEQGAADIAGDSANKRLHLTSITDSFYPPNPCLTWELAIPRLLGAFGLDIVPPSRSTPASGFGMRIEDGLGAGTVLYGDFDDLDAGPRDFASPLFLGVLADPGYEFTRISLVSTLDFRELSLDNLTYGGASTVPEPGAMAMGFGVTCTLGFVAWRRKRA